VLVSVEHLVKIPQNATLNDRKFSNKKHWKPTKGHCLVICGNKGLVREEVTR